MILSGYGEFRGMDGSAALYARFTREDGKTLDLYITQDQLVQLAEFSGGGDVVQPAPPANTAKAAQGPSVGYPAADRLEFVDDEGPLRLGASPGYLAAGGDPDDL